MNDVNSSVVRDEQQDMKTVEPTIVLDKHTIVEEEQTNVSITLTS